VVSLDGEAIAYHLGFECNGRFIWYKPTFEVALARHAPGEVLIKFLLEEASARGLLEFVFGPGEEPFKYRFSNPLECLVATILSAQCTDEKVNEVTAALFVKYRSPQDYLRVPEDELKADIKPTGFFNQKATSIRAACQRIVEVYDGEVPDTMEDLITLRGVARKTANIVMGNAYGNVQGVAVDTHVKRVSNRLRFSDHADADKIEQDLMRLLPQEKWFPFTYVLIDHGRAICVARSRHEVSVSGWSGGS